MPGYGWLFENTLTGEDSAKKLEVMQSLGVPYTDEQIAQAAGNVKGVIEGEALIRYLQTLGLDMQGYGAGK